VKDIPLVKLREDFPFLKKVSCPTSLKALVADKITAYHKYTKAHAQLFEATTEKEQLVAVSTLVNNYIENREIFDELNHYKKFNKILGKHKSFIRFKRERQLHMLSTLKLSVLKTNLEKYVRRYKKILKGDIEPILKFSSENKLEKYSWELEVVKEILQNR